MINKWSKMQRLKPNPRFKKLKISRRNLVAVKD
jgi:hypothetical protein